MYYQLLVKVCNSNYIEFQDCPPGMKIYVELDYWNTIVLVYVKCRPLKLKNSSLTCSPAWEISYVKIYFTCKNIPSDVDCRERISIFTNEL